MHSILYLGVVLLVAAVECQLLSEVVVTDKGPIVGRIYETSWHSLPYSAFLGIPYAEPPLGPLRFKDPIEHTPWLLVKNTTQNAAFCKQFFLDGAVGSEDCLYINVYTPRTNFLNIPKTELKPVMAWIYGGGFTTGYTLYGLYEPDFFLEEDVVFVSFNYRVDILGFLTLDLPGVQGNQGMKDQQLAMAWIKKNIALFGGDPNRVTLFGQGAGAASVGYHLLAPTSLGLFHQAILQSGSPLCPWAYQDRAQAIQRAFSVAATLGYSPLTQVDLLTDLQGVSDNELLTATQFFASDSLPAPITLPFVPTITADFLDDCPISKFRRGEFAHVPILMGYTAQEAILLNLVYDASRETIYKELQSLTNAALGSSLVVDLVNDVANISETETVDVASAYYFSNPIDLTQRYLAKHSISPVYYYRLSYRSDYLIHMLLDNTLNATSHFDDIGLLFDVHIIYPMDPLHPFNLYRQKLVKMWANFVKFGNPTPANIPINNAVWEPSGVAGLQLDIDDINVMKPRLLVSSYEEFEKLYDLALPVTSKCLNPSPQVADIF